MGRGGTANHPFVLEELLRVVRRPDMGGGFGGRASIAGHTRRTTGAVKRVCVAVVCSALDVEFAVAIGTIWCVCVGRLQNLLKEERLAGASLIIFANKQDLAGALSMADIAKVLELDKIVKYVSASVVLPARFSLICVDGVEGVAGSV